MHCYILILFNVFFFTFVNDKVVTYVKNLFEKNLIITSTNLNNESSEFNQYQRFTVDNIHSYQTLWFYCFKIEYDIIEEFEKEKSNSKLLY